MLLKLNTEHIQNEEINNKNDALQATKKLLKMSNPFKKIIENLHNETLEFSYDSEGTREVRIEGLHIQLDDGLRPHDKHGKSVYRELIKIVS